MYRKSFNMANEVTTQPIDSAFIKRVSNLPIVTAAANQLVDVYCQVKNSHNLVKYTFETAESGMITVSGKAMPLVSKLPVDQLDGYACNQLDKLEEKYPLVNKSTDAWKESGYGLYESTMKTHVDKVSSAKDYSYQCIHSAKEYGKDKIDGITTYTAKSLESAKTMGYQSLETGINCALELPVTQGMLSKLDIAMDTAENYVDYYLPKEAKEEETSGECNDDLKKVAAKVDRVQRLSHLSSKVRQRTMMQAMRQIKHVQMRSQETIQKLNFTVDLIEYAKENMGSVQNKISDAKDKFYYLWDEVSKNEEHADESVLKDECETVNDVTFERRAIATARDLTLKLRHSFDTLNTTMRVLPSTIQCKLSSAKLYTEDLYQTFDTTTTFSDLPSKLLTETRNRLGYLTEMIGYLTEVTSEYLMKKEPLQNDMQKSEDSETQNEVHVEDQE